MALTPGTRLGVYEVTAQIGEGGMGQVYRARDTKLDRDVAIKILPEAFAYDADRLARFQREAKTLASLNHPNIAAIYGLEESGGMTALVMELVEGDDLSQRIAQGAIPVDEALPIAKQIAEALEAAHEQGIIHRDLKPANVKLRPDGVVKVLDFGLAKALEPTGAMSPGMSQAPTITTPAMTQAGMILGTAAYMSPEQARGKPVDKRTDIWAFGCVLYEMLTGQRVFGGEDITVTLARVVEREPDWTQLPGTLPVTLRTYLRRCLEKDPKQRIRDIGDVSLALEGAFETGASETSDGAAMSVVPQPVGWRRAIPFALTALVVGSIVGVTVWNLRPSESRAVGRFDYDLPEGHQFRSMVRSLVAFSADGRHFVYNTTEGLYLRSMEDLEARLIPGTEALLGTPFFSPDGQWIGFYQSGQLKKIAVSGGAPVILCEATELFGVSWGPDDTILFGQFEGIMRVSANGGTPELVIPAEEGEQMDSPQLLPDGDSVLFAVTRSSGASRWDEAQVVVQSLRSGERNVLLEGGSDARYLPSGHLIYAFGNGLFALRFDMDSLDVSGGPVSVLQEVQRASGPDYSTASANYAISDRGTLIYVPVRAPAVADRTLALVDRNGTRESLSMRPASYLHPRLSPDGTRVAVQAIDDDGRSAVWIYDLSGDIAVRRLTQQGNNVRPIWTPDGERVTFASDRDGTMSVYWQRADGSDVAERLTTAEESYQEWPESWSPDGGTLSFNRALGGGQTIWTLSLDSGAEPERFSDANGVGSSFSPDGRWLAYSSNEEGTNEIYVQPFPPTGVKHRVTEDGGLFPVWSPDGRELFYRRSFNATGGQDPRLMGVDIAAESRFAFGNEQTLPIEGFLIFNTYRDYDITPDGERLVMVFPADSSDGAETARPQIILVQNWFTELERLVPVD